MTMDRTGRLFVITYDIEDSGRRTKVANTLKGYGERVQLSVFECWLNTGELNVLKERLQKLIDPDNDSVRFYRPQGEVIVLGAGSAPKETKFYLA